MRYFISFVALVFLSIALPIGVSAQCAGLLERFSVVDTLVEIIERNRVFPDDRMMVFRDGRRPGEIAINTRLINIYRTISRSGGFNENESIAAFALRKIREEKNQVTRCDVAPLRSEYLLLLSNAELLFTKLNRPKVGKPYFNETLLGIYHTYRNGVNIMEGQRPGR